MKRLVFIGILLIITAMPCWGGGKEDFIAAGNRWDAGNREDALDHYQKAIDDLEKFLALEPDNTDHIYLLEQLKNSLAKQEGIAVAQ